MPEESQLVFRSHGMALDCCKYITGEAQKFTFTVSQAHMVCEGLFCWAVTLGQGLLGGWVCNQQAPEFDHLQILCNTSATCEHAASCLFKNGMHSTRHRFLIRASALLPCRHRVGDRGLRWLFGSVEPNEEKTHVSAPQSPCLPGSWTPTRQGLPADAKSLTSGPASVCASVVCRARACADFCGLANEKAGLYFQCLPFGSAMA